MRNGRHKKRQKRIVFSIITAAVLLTAAAFVCFGTDLFRAPASAASPALTQTPVLTSARTPAQTTDEPDKTTSDTASPSPEATDAAAAEFSRSLYEAVLTIFPGTRQPYLEGALRLTYVNNSPDVLYEIKLHLYPNDVSAGCMSVSDVAANDEIAYYTLDGANKSILSVSLPKEIGPGDSAEIYLNFSVILPQTDNRFGINETGIMLGNMLPIAAVYENGAWRTDAYTSEGDAFYSECADYRVAVNAPSTWELAYTGSLVDKNAGPRVTSWYIVASRVRDFAMALMENPKIETRQTASGTTTVYAFGTTRSHAAYEADVAAAALDYFSANIGEYPYDTFFVVPFSMSGGMEYPGLIMIYERYLHMSDMADTDLVIGHETAHQWFYAVVGSDQINAPWLDESLVEFLGFDFLRSYSGEEKMNEIRDERFASLAGYQRTIPIDASLYDFSGSDYFYVVYGCGSMMYDALYNELGRDVFYQALTDYFNENSFAVADRDDLFAAFSEAAGTDMPQWFEQRLAPGS